MNRQTRPLTLLCAAMAATATVLVLPTANADVVATPAARAATGTIVGIVRNAAHLPVAYATVTAARADGTAIRSTLSGSDGVYAFADLPAGEWTVTAAADGLPEVALPAITVAAAKATRSDIVMNGGVETSPTQVASAAPVAGSAQTVGAPPVASAAQVAAAANHSAPAWLTAAAGNPQVIPEALESPDPGPEVDTYTPFAVTSAG